VDWKKLGKQVAELGAPLLGFALGGPGGAALASTITASLGLSDSTPAAISQALNTDPEAATKMLELQTRHKERIEEIALDRYRAERDADAKEQAQINETMRVEYKSQGTYKTGWRPAFGWIAALGFGGILCALVYSMFKEPAQAAKMVESATVVLSLMLAVLGININKRSQDKQSVLPNRPIGILEAVATRIAK